MTKSELVERVVYHTDGFKGIVKYCINAFVLMTAVWLFINSIEISFEAVAPASVYIDDGSINIKREGNGVFRISSNKIHESMENSVLCGNTSYEPEIINDDVFKISENEQDCKIVSNITTRTPHGFLKQRSITISTD